MSTDTTFEEKGEPKRIRTEITLLTSLTVYRWAKPVHLWRLEKREIIYLSLYYHHHNDSCIKMGSNESRFNVSFIMGDTVSRQCPQTTTFEEKESLSGFDPRSVWR